MSDPFSRDPFNLAGRVALVTGADKGLGQGLCLALAQAGADIAGVSRTPATDCAKAVEALGRKFLPLHADLSTTEPCACVVAETIRGLGRLDILVNNAGIIRRADALDFTEKDWDDVMNVNLKTAFFLCQASAREMVKQGGGKIINIASVLSFQGGIRVASYTASKGGIAGITRLLACEWASKNINVNAIAPGYMATDNTSQLRQDESRSKEILARIPAGRWGEPSDLGGAVVFLASRASDYVHGAILPVDGGWLSR